jgi:hypothetical protein
MASLQQKAARSLTPCRGRAQEILAMAQGLNGDHLTCRPDLFCVNAKRNRRRRHGRFGSYALARFLRRCHVVTLYRT